MTLSQPKAVEGKIEPGRERIGFEIAQLERGEVRLPIRFPAVRRITVDDFSRCILPDKNGAQVLPRAEMPEPGGKAVQF